MKKSYFWGLLLAMMALIPSQNAFADYCTVSVNHSRSDRHLDAITLTDGAQQVALTNIQPNNGSSYSPKYPVYCDKTASQLTTAPGATLHFSTLTWTGSWMHAYVYIDYDNSGDFTQADLVSYNYYNGQNSKGESVSNNCGVTANNMPSWTLPTDLASGTYRLRFKVDWDNIDPCGASSIANDGGVIMDLTLNVEAAIPERTIDVTVAPEGAGTVTGAGTAMGNITLAATATPGYEFVNWTLNGEVVGTDLSYTDASEGDKTYVANFAALTAYPEMSYLYTNGMNQANRYLKEVVATAGETVTTVFSATTETELPKVDPDVTGSATTQGAYVDKTENPIIILEGTTEFTVNFKAWTTAMTISGTSATTQLNWTQQAVFIDWNNNFCFYEEGENYGKNGDGMPNADFIAADGFVRTFSVPAGVQPGVYRMRVCYFEPNGNNAEQWQNTIFEKGNCVTRNGKTYDFAVEIRSTSISERVINVVASPADAGVVTANGTEGGITSNELVTIEAVANAGYRFVEWKNGETSVSTSPSFTDATEGDKTYTANFVKVYSVTATAENGTVQISGQNSEGTFDEGATATLVATPSVGYSFVNWTLNGENVGESATLNVVVSANVEYVANFEKDYFISFGNSTTDTKGALTSITFNIGGEAQTIQTGKTSSSGAIYVDKLSEVITIEAGTQVESLTTEGHVGNDWMHGYLYVDWNGDKSFTRELDGWVPTEASELIAYGFWVGQDGDGSHGGVDDSNGYNHLGNQISDSTTPDRSTNGALEAFTIPVNIPAGDYRARYKLDWNCINPDATLDVNQGAMVLDFTLRVTSAAVRYVVSATSADETMGTAEVSATEVVEGTEVIFTATPAEGYQFVNWTVGEEIVSVENPYTTAVTADVALIANFEPIKYTVTVNAGLGGTAEASATEVVGGTEVTFTATAAQGYAFEGWTSAGAESVYYIQNYSTNKYLGYNSSNMAAIDNQTSDVTIAPSTMNEGEFTIYLTNATYDQQTPPQAQSYLHCGSNGRFSGNSVNTSASQQIAIFKVEDPTAETITATKVSEITSGATYMFVGLKNDVYYALTDELYKEGTTDQRMVGAAVEVTDGTISFVPGTSYALWTIVNKSFVSDENPYTVVVTEDINLTANFVEVPVVKYSVSAEASPAEAGNVTISATEVEENGTVDLTATANTGYEFVNWTVEGAEVSTEASFTATVTAATAYVANFVAQEFTITYMVDGEEYASETYAFGATVTPQVVAPEKEGYTFSGWSEIPATMPAENVTATASFAVNSYDIVYKVDGEVYTTETYEFGATVTPVAAPEKEGYTFSGWSAIPATMPANDVEVTGSFIVKADVVVTEEDKEETADAIYANVTVASDKVWTINDNEITADKVSVAVSVEGEASEVKIQDGGQVTAALEVNRIVKKGQWAMMSMPFAVDLANVTVNGVAAQNNVNIKVMVYDADKRANESIELWTKSGWVDLTGTTIAANQGFAVAVNAQNGDEQTVTFAAATQTYDGSDKEVALDRHASTVNEGADADWNFFGNPTLAKAEKGTGYALYVYNAEDDSYDEYASSDAVTYQPYTAMFAQSADDFNALSFSAGIAGALADANGVYGEMQFSLNGEDEARVVLSDEASEEYVRNEDALYFAAPNANLSQLYIVKGKVKMAVSEQPTLSESMTLGYKAAKAGEQTLALTSLPDNTGVVLKDNVTGDEVALTVGDSYTFESAAGTFNSRFVVIPTDLTGIAQATVNGDVKVVVNGDDINVYGVEAGVEVVAYATNGMVVASAVAAEGVTTLSTSANGVIIVKAANTAIKVVK